RPQLRPGSVPSLDDAPRLGPPPAGEAREGEERATAFAVPEESVRERERRARVARVRGDGALELPQVLVGHAEILARPRGSMPGPAPPGAGTSSRPRISWPGRRAARGPLLANTPLAA